MSALVPTRVSDLTADPALKEAFGGDGTGELPLTAEEIAAVNALAQRWAEANLAAYQAYLFAHVRKLLLMGFPVSTALKELTVDPRQILMPDEDLDALERGRRLPRNGRSLVTTQDGQITRVTDAKDSCLVNGRDPMNVYTFTREFVSREALPVMIDVALERLKAMAQHAPRMWPND